LRETIGGWFRRRARDAETEFWALHDASFDIAEGETVGVIGRNGAGKSTLLKILARVTEPSRGEVRLRGRVGSLLEVGTGFHPELTGRENVFLSGAILGMKQSELRRRFDEIVDFADIERFLDTPVKRYSSGMYMRLAFSVATWALVVTKGVQFFRSASGNRKYVGVFRAAPNLQASEKEILLQFGQAQLVELALLEVDAGRIGGGVDRRFAYCIIRDV